ncbi:canalicular multispecific organic anion transporter 1, partial [Saccharata proteae CBS 121410]
LPIISAVPTAVAACILICYCLRPVVRGRPQWTKNFATEADLQQPEVGSRPGKRWTHWNAALVLLSIVGLLLSIVAVVLTAWTPVQVFMIFPWTIATLLLAVQRPRTTPVSLFALFSVMLACELIVVISLTNFARLFFALTIAESCICIVAMILIMAMPMRDPNMEAYDIARSSKPPTYDLRSPEDNLTLWQFMTVSWMTPLISAGSKKKLNDEDVWKLPFEFQHSRLHTMFRELKGTVVRRLFTANGIDLVITSTLGVVESVANLSAPVLLQQLLRSIENESSINSGLIYAALILVVRLIACQSAVFSLWYCRRAYERSRGEMITMIYEKTLTRKSFGSPADEKSFEIDGNGNENSAKPDVEAEASEGFFARLRYFFAGFMGSRKSSSKSPSKTAEKKVPASMGKILNLMRHPIRNDVYEVAQRFWEFPNIITKPLGFILCIVLIWRLLGWPSLIGMLCVVVAQIINALLVRSLLRWERIRRSATDSKLQIISQFVEAIRHLRWYDWQNQWLEKTMSARQRELNLRIVTSLWNIAIKTMNMLATCSFPVAAFYAYTVISGQPLRIDIAFPALELFNMLDTSMRELPGLITVLLNATVAVGRIEDFMAEPDKSETYIGDVSSDVSLAIREGSFAWPGSPNLVLEDITVDFPVGLTVICGKVGEGKTALLQSLLGELDKRCGEVFHPDEMVGYCAQSPWLQSMSIRENILFISPFEEQRYKQVLDACALIPDLANFKHGDLSDIGENGIGLSGGQKARLALARAVYSQARILLLDDPFAGLDHNTAETIVRRLLRGPLVRDRVVVLVTHRTDLCCHLADKVVEIRKGKAYILDSGEMASGNNFSTEYSDQNVDGASLQAQSEQQNAAIPDKFIEEEHRADGGVMASVYWQYVKSGKLGWWALLIVLFALFRINRLFNFWFLKAWGEAYGTAQELSSTEFLSGIFDKLPPPESDVRPWLVGYFLIAVITTVLYVLSEFVLLIIVYTAGKGLFREVMRRVSNATFRFYDVTPVGRLMNRLTSDIGTLDGNISDQLQSVAWYFIAWSSSVVVIAATTPLFLVFSCVLTAGFIYVFMRFLPTSQSLRRLEMVSLSPLMSNFGALLDGLTTVRAFRAQPHFQDRNIVVVDAFQKMDHFYWSLQAWLMYRFDALSACSTFILTLLALYNDISPGLTAFVLTAAARFVQATHALCKQYGQLQMDFVSVERVVELIHLEEEPSGTVAPPASWPSYEDDIVFDHVVIKYAPHLDPSLSDVSFRIPGRSTCAVIGRTGSGKSTMALALLGTVLPEAGGSISIGNMEIGKVDVHALRQRVSFVAQDPVLFPGTMRQNLDPLHEHSDEECIAVLGRVLGPEWNLGSKIDGGGRNLSQGQRQLVGLGRAVLRRSPIVILDEATASIDKATAIDIQQVLRDELQESTVITIAHRLEAVKDADYCIVLDKGKVAAAGPAHEIMKRDGE